MRTKTSRQGASKHMDDNLERLVHNLTLGQGHVMNQVGHAAYLQYKWQVASDDRF